MNRDALLRQGRVRPMFAMAIGALGLLSGTVASAAPTTIGLSVQVDQANKTWRAYATLAGDTTSTLGLSALQIDVVSGGGILLSPISTANNDLAFLSDTLPSGLPKPNPTTYAAGFQLAADNFGTDKTQVTPNDEQFFEAQPLVYHTDPTGKYNDLAIGVGIPSITGGNIGNNAQNGGMPYVWGNPVLIADGTYTGNAGTISALGDPATSALLPAVLPADGGNITSTPPDAVTPGNAVIGVPEPGTIGLIGIAALGLLARRRRTA
jgi:hypothetical protein